MKLEQLFSILPNRNGCTEFGELLKIFVKERLNPGAPLAYTVGVKTGLLHGYKLERINVILDPENADKRGFGYHTWQSMVTVGEGGVAGARNSEYSQSSLKFLPEPHTDFIFAVTAETTGFVGCLLLLASYALLLTRLITDARRSRDRTGMLVIMAIVGGLIFQIILNVGMALGMLPVIGVPLPLMSAGLSSVQATGEAEGLPEAESRARGSRFRGTCWASARRRGRRRRGR